MEKKEYEIGGARANVHRRGGPRGGRPGGGEKAKDLVGTWKKLLVYCKKYLPMMIVAIVCAIGGTILTILGPDKLSDLTSHIESGFIRGTETTSAALNAIFTIGITLVCFYATSWLLSALQSWIMATATQRISKNMRKDISHKINKLPMWYYNRTATGDVLSRVTNDVDTIGQSFNQSVGTLVSQIVLFLGSLIMMLITNWIMALTAVAATLLGFVIMMLIMGRSQKYFNRNQKDLGNLNGYIEEIYAGHTVIKAYNGEQKINNEFDALNEKLHDSGFKAHALSGLMMPLMTFIGNFAYVAVCIVGAVLTMNGTIGFPVIVAFILYVRYFTQPLSQIAQSMQSLQSAAAAGERVFEFLEAEEMEDETHKTKRLENVKGEVSFEHVKFGYEDSDKTVIHDFSAVAKPGQKIAIVGPTGAGKTTMVNLLMRFHELQGGEIRIDGTSTKEVTRENVHDYIFNYKHATGQTFGVMENNLWLLWGIWGIFIVEMIFRFFPSKMESAGCQKQFACRFQKTRETKPQLQSWQKTFTVAIAWIFLNSVVFLLYFLNVIDEGILLLISLAYSVCDMICILFFCPFQTWIMKNKCCGTCRIYNWDYAMIFTPLICVRHPLAISLVVFSLILLLYWEISVRLHPERFSEKTNAYLSCNPK